VTVYAHAFFAWYPFRRRPWVWPLVAGAILPDLPYCVLFVAAAVERGPRAFTDLALWRSIWGHHMVVGLHSFLPWGAAMLLLISTRGWRRSPGVSAFLAGWGSHVVIDMLTHRSDGYPIFWPLSVYRFPTPVSYWESAYHGRAFALACDGAMVVLLIRLALLRLRRDGGARASRPVSRGRKHRRWA
jgi:membrane-bound metal-dependent hydrolase YbcI (DUF457 family)